MVKFAAGFLAGVLFSMSVHAQNLNPWQPPQPSNQNYKTRLAGLPDPVFSVDFHDGDITPELGTGGTFTRASAQTYGDSLTSVAYKASGEFAVPGLPFNGVGAFGGYEVYGARKNFLLYSEDLSNAAWADVGTPAATTLPGNIAAPDGNATGSLLTTDAANEGVLQDSGVASASTTWVFSAYVQSVSGTVAGVLTIEGTGATPETTTQAFTATTSWTRVKVGKAFSASATGNATPKITLDAAGSVRLWGLQLESGRDATYGSLTQSPTAYIKTTSAVAVTAANVLTYPSGNISGALTKGSVSAWISVPWTQAELVNNDSKLLFTHNAFQLAVGANKTSGADKLFFYFGSGSNLIHNVTQTLPRNTWVHLVATWDNSGAAINSELFYQGASIATNTTTAPTTPGATTVYLGSRASGATGTYFDGILSQFKWYASKLDATQVTMLYNAEKGGYGL